MFLTIEENRILTNKKLSAIWCNRAIVFFIATDYLGVDLSQVRSRSDLAPRILLTPRYYPILFNVVVFKFLSFWVIRLWDRHLAFELEGLAQEIDYLAEVFEIASF